MVYKHYGSECKKFEPLDPQREEQDKNKIFVKIDIVTVKKLAKLASPHEIEPDLIKRVIEHALVCDKWCLEQKDKTIL